MLAHRQTAEIDKCQVQPAWVRLVSSLRASSCWLALCGGGGEGSSFAITIRKDFSSRQESTSLWIVSCRSEGYALQTKSSEKAKPSSRGTGRKKLTQILQATAVADSRPVSLAQCSSAGRRHAYFGQTARPVATVDAFYYLLAELGLSRFPMGQQHLKDKQEGCEGATAPGGCCSRLRRCCAVAACFV